MQSQGYTPLDNKKNNLKKIMRAAGTCAAAMAVSLLLVACLQTIAPIGQRFMQQYTDAHQQGHIHSMQDLCGKLSGSAQQLCYQYVGAAKEDAWDAAAAWRRTSPESCKFWWYLVRSACC